MRVGGFFSACQVSAAAPRAPAGPRPSEAVLQAHLSAELLDYRIKTHHDQIEVFSNYNFPSPASLRTKIVQSLEDSSCTENTKTIGAINWSKIFLSSFYVW